jgi:hypothetical protein
LIKLKKRFSIKKLIKKKTYSSIRVNFRIYYFVIFKFLLVIQSYWKISMLKNQKIFNNRRGVYLGKKKKQSYNRTIGGGSFLVKKETIEQSNNRRGVLLVQIRNHRTIEQSEGGSRKKKRNNWITRWCYIAEKKEKSNKLTINIYSLILFCNK